MKKKRLEERINTYSEHLKKKFGEKVFRVGLSTGIVCPHRRNHNGCIFCNPYSFTDRHQQADLEIPEQLKKIIPLIREQCGSSRYLAYFQDETSTAGDPEFLKKKYLQAVSHPDISGLIVSTRPDFLNRKIAGILAELQVPVTVEIGMQSRHDRSLRFLKRGHSMKDVEKAISLCAESGLETGVHLIIGIPGEDLNDMKQTIKYVSGNNSIKQVKFHNLVVYQNTELAEIYYQGKVGIFHIEDHIRILSELIPFLRGDITITRLFTSNIRNSNLTMRKYEGNKTKWLAKLRDLLNEKEIIQGSKTGKMFDLDR